MIIGLDFDIRNPSLDDQMMVGLEFDIRNPSAGDKMIAGPDFDIHNPSADQMMVDYQYYGDRYLTLKLFMRLAMKTTEEEA
ncbi:uncharacterized protein OCT59_026411 [Rhizophagus irregularis]|uniref:uncharacterized protein n=1 Tax=Rhizophagus irregularis TaxID=588596 RepID=UPI00331CA83B|nr:hypothetical protein OCT59_026411 [Rhizophagus irregularis]